MLDSGVNLTVVECAYGERPFELAGIAHINHVPVRAKSLVWTKENLINVGFSDSQMTGLIPTRENSIRFGFPLPARCDSIPAAIRGRRAWAER